MTKAKTRFRPLDGILLLDKPQGLSSNQALQQARHLFRAEKGGHTGSLDPLATGLLPLCFGEATKIAGLLLGSAKAYETTAVLGLTTDSDDADGAPLLERPVPVLDDAAIEAALVPLRGPIRQRAPIYSALKQGGEPLYAKARRGESIEAPERDVVVHRFELLDRDGPRLRLHVECGSGTYVRSLVRDLGETLGCGAHVATLRRLWVDPFRAPAMHTLESVRSLLEEGGETALEACLLPIEAGLSQFPRVELEAEAARRLGMGQAVDCPAGEEGLVAVFGTDGRCLGIGQRSGERLAPQRLFRWAAQSGEPEQAARSPA
ncbi:MULTISPECIES: tRNA pseudouridine(55) synthase TruB [unclassified Lysobacter]|uniref:tRNA pseudouridine(55) synthase TruB n=1 Tax=unclassified Lysobacter TaxID=2635362 RepID=UPI001C241875|nr:tRNA pseudouridine(55) synthase TruB [Lysobacter sp. MMG2]MBU8974833.1 tRNA pseudouridine(55) synthase TruB [Lysobacter sp. MMG2]